MNQIEKALTKFGLTDNEVKVYLEALNHKETSPYALSKATGIPRTTVYDVLMGLSLKGLVTLTQSDGYSKQQTRIRAKNPTELRAILRKKQKELVETEIDILDVLPELKETYHQDGKANAECHFYPGVEGARKVYYASYLPEVNVEVMAFENMMPMDVFGRKEMNKDVSDGPEQRLQKGVRVRELMPLTDWTKHVLTYQCGREPHYLDWRELRYIDTPAFDLNQRIVMQGNRVAISCARDEEAWGLIIKSKSLAASFKAIYEVMWQQGKAVTPEFVKSLGENLFLEVEQKKKKRTI